MHRTLAQAIEYAAQNYPERGFTFQNMTGEETKFTFVQVEEATARLAKGMQDMGLVKGDRIGLIVVEPQEFVLNFLAAIRIGVVPVPLYPPLSFGALDAYVARTTRVLEMSEAKYLFASERLQNILWSIVDEVPTLKKLVRVEDFSGADGRPEFPELALEDLCFLQYTSGSTSDPKGVMVTHGSLAANAEAIIMDGLDSPEDRHDVGVSWLPLYHDMGLIGFVIAPIYYVLDVVYIPTMRFIKRPNVWMDTISRHKGTITFAPNFALALATRKAKDRQLESWDLSSLRVVGCGAEPIHPSTVRAFTETMGKANMPANSVLPAYGMAEATLAMSFKPLAQEMRTVVVDAKAFQEDGKVQEPAGQDSLVFEHVSCGPTFSKHKLVAMDEAGNVLPEGSEGELCFAGPSVTPGYFNNPEATAAAYRDGWLHTGDLGYILDGEVFVTGRLKDLIILNGRNLHPQSIEWACQDVPGVRKGNIVAFSRTGANSEELVIVLETRETETEQLVADVKASVRKEISVAPADVVCLPPGSLPKTSSGKLQRRKTRSQYLTGELGGEGVRTMGSSASKVTLARHVAKSLWSRAKSRLRN